MTIVLHRGYGIKVQNAACMGPLKKREEKELFM